MKATYIGKKKTKIIVSREPTDPICMRVSIGGKRDVGFYITVRGDDLEEIKELIKETLEALNKVQPLLEP